MGYGNTRGRRDDRRERKGRLEYLASKSVAQTVNLYELSLVNVQVRPARNALRSDGIRRKDF